MAYSYSYYVDELRRKIKRYRIESGISQQKLSELTGVSVRSLQRFEKGSDISFENLMKIFEPAFINNWPVCENQGPVVLQFFYDLEG